MSGTKPPNSGDEDYPPDARLQAIYAAIEARLAEFDRCRDDLLAMLQKVCERTPKPFDEKYAWRHVRFYAWRYLEEEEASAEKRMMVPAADRVDRLRQLGNALREARSKLDETRHDVTCVVLFEEWCKARGISDFTDRHVDIFEDALADLIAGLAYMETAASRAAEQVRQKPGRPGGTGVLQHDIVIMLEAAYQNITGRRGGAGPGPFAQFVTKFLEGLGRTITQQSVIEAIKAAKKRQGEQWGQSPFADIGGETPPSSL